MNGLSLDSRDGWPQEGRWNLDGSDGSLPHSSASKTPGVRKTTLRGGPGDGLEVVELDSGPLQVFVLPGRGMGLWKASCDGMPIQWDSPVEGPVHPHRVQLERRGGLGWLDGFNELLCRCGLAFNGPPGKDSTGYPITLHGRIANLPAHALKLTTDSASGKVSVTGTVLESSLFDSRLELTTTYTLTQGTRTIEIHDRIVNKASTSAEVQLLYHFNVGRPLLDQGCKIHAPVQEMSPQTPHAAQAVGHWDCYAGPVSGFREEVYLFRLHGGKDRRTTVVLENSRTAKGIAVRFRLDQLPCFTLWKQTGALEDAFVTGLEPATGFPNFKDFEREQKRVVSLAPNQAFEADWSIEILPHSTKIQEALREVQALTGSSTIHPLPHPEFTPHGK